MRPFAVTVLPCEAGAGDCCSLALVVVAGVCVGHGSGAWGAVAAAVGVHPGQKVCVRPPLVEAVMAGDSSARRAHLDEGVALGLMTCHRDSAPFGSLQDHLLLEGSRGRGGRRRRDGGGGGGVVGG